MAFSRRTFLKSSLSSLAIASGLSLLPRPVKSAIWSQLGFTELDLNTAMQAALGQREAQISDQIIIDVPNYTRKAGIIEVPIYTHLPSVDAIALFVTRNTMPLAALYNFAPETEPFIISRMDIYNTTDIIAIARSEGKLFSNTNKVIVVEPPGTGYFDPEDPFSHLYDPFDDLEEEAGFTVDIDILEGEE